MFVNNLFHSSKLPTISKIFKFAKKIKFQNLWKLGAFIQMTLRFSVYFAIAGRFFVGFADALLQPAVNSLITRWFPTSERSYALGLATGGRQLGTETYSASQ